MLPRKIAKGPVALARTLAVPLEVKDLCAEGAGDGSGLVRAMGIDDADFISPGDGFQTLGDILLFVSSGNQNGHRYLHFRVRG